MLSENMMPELLYLIPELCRQTGLSDEMRNNFQLMKALATHTKLGPDARIQKLMEFNRRLTGTPEVIKNNLYTWAALTAERDPRSHRCVVGLLGRIEGKVNRWRGSGASNTKVGRWKGRGHRNFHSLDENQQQKLSKELLSLGQVPSWAVITPERQRRDAEGFVDLIIRTGSGVGFNLPRPEIVPIRHDSANEYAQASEGVISRRNPAFLLFVLARQTTDRYETIKKKCYIDRAIPSQVVCGRSLTNKNAMSIATKVAIQINCKMGGAPWTVEIPVTGLMVVGYDVCHDTRNKSRSFGAMVASLDQCLSQYYSAVNAHQSGEELSSHMSFNIGAALVKYRERNGALPTRIMIYRDGVGDGQIPYVVQHEVVEIKKKLSEIYNGNNYKMCFIIVSKRINTRVFVERGGRGVDNPRPGTVIDDVVTLPERYDFFLVSQCVREGTVAPTSYNVIEDNLGLSPDRIQRLTYKMTHLYYNCSNQVRVPAVCQYAHKLAFMAGQSLHGQPHYSLSTSLYFL
ncbi:Piwi-like protein Siwi [Eumeta japonica]|uniref:Piwi-like protein Siwi n=1 Tax=Eumeta variegata TaxID=151549 RepID=A0A4C1W6D1_EUMVA|nr:Piwi-like protein Siwi [Eumeta japonica]